MNFWLLAVLILQIGLGMCAIACMRGRLSENIVAMEMATVIGVFSVALLAEGVGRPAWFDLALALALLSFPSGLVFLVFMKDWL